MSYAVAIMLAVAALTGLAGLALLLMLRTPEIGEARTYAYRMIGIMLAAFGVVLAMSATAMWSWGAEG